ncbi:YdbH domain-containing protein [Novosphingobium flavum]|uniref:YdbH domain-containing protein n=1 Tax=Novosphingobium flavum TaxID=1778672 RepID=A0A7X1FTJ8_9SPHN|nr:YdbH domain-containing protein [Novosphingobium flavum]MBC2666212.1 YdbH domain-containing protein [Novosphingobium flavum]
MNETSDGEPQGAATIYPEQEGPDLGSGERRRRWLRVLGVAGGVVGLALGAVWVTRNDIADNVIAGQLRQLGLPGTYRVDSIGPRRQVISNIVIGDPAHPDLTIERAEIEIEPRLGYPEIGTITLVRPRLYGRLVDGKASFGSLDKLLYGPKGKGPFRLPDIALNVIDGRGRLTGAMGPVGIKLDGRGNLRSGFAGEVAAVAPELVLGSCRAKDASLYGSLTMTAEKPHLLGPLRLGRVDCGVSGPRLAKAEIGVDAVADKDFTSGTARLDVATGGLALGTSSARGLNGSADLAYRSGALTAKYDLLGRGLATAWASASTLAAKGVLRARDGFARLDVDTALDGGGLRPGEAMSRSLGAIEEAGADSLVAPVMRQIRAALVREGRASRLAADVVLRRANGNLNVVVPQGQLIGGSGQTLLALSRVQYASGGARADRLAGNFTTGGPGLPRITGRMTKGPRGDTQVALTMAEYRAEGARIALPRLVVAQTTNGALGFSGTAIASGPLPGGRAENLTIPIDGRRTPGGVLSLWSRCETVRFDALAYANLALDSRSLLLCPGPGGSIVRSGPGGTRIAFGTPSLDLSGRLGETPIRINSGPVGYAQPGALFARELDVALGPADSPTRLRLADLKATVGKEISGTFAGTDARLFSVPLDLLDATGQWTLVDGRLTVSNAAFRLEDRAQVDRFQPLAAEGAGLVLADNRITADAVLREPASRREVAGIAVRHDLASGRGHADLVVDGLVFDDRLQPDTLTRQLLGVVANARGTVKGRGQFDWTASDVTSSGRFSTDSLDFAAAFGPVKSASGTVEFTDLVNFTTAPHQRLAIASINPGIEVTDGAILFQMKKGNVLAVEGGEWPFLGGMLHLRPVDLNIGVAETRRYVLDIEALDAAKFVAQMELANISATGAFDGSLPLVFDENGGRIEGGLLASRPPGGNLSYVGALTYKDLSPIANFAFDALKSLDYKQMRIAMDGALEGNIVTRVRFDGVKQGAGAKRNIVTRRFANLPLQFNVNIRAPFYQLITSFKAMYDPAYVKDPRTLGLLGPNGKPIVRPADIQPPVSETRP